MKFFLNYIYLHPLPNIYNFRYIHNYRLHKSTSFDLVATDEIEYMLFASFVFETSDRKHN